jgi:hypothetical protein
MRVQNEPEKKDRELNFISLFSFLLVISIILSVIFSSITLSLAANEKLSVVLLDRGEIYVQSGSSHTFLQDYEIHIKGVDPEGKRVWVELNRKGVSLKDAIVTENSQFVYSQNSTEILNLTISTIYAGADGSVLVKFSPVYQHLDPGLPKPDIPDKPQNNSSGNNSSGEPASPTTRAEGFNMSLFFLALGTLLLFMGFIAKKLWKK